jgi:hypothetical protein
VAVRVSVGVPAGVSDGSGEKVRVAVRVDVRVGEGVRELREMCGLINIVGVAAGEDNRHETRIRNIEKMAGMDFLLLNIIG